MEYEENLTTQPDCPECGSQLKRFPPKRKGMYHVFCDQCNHDFGRYDQLLENYTHLVDELDRKLGLDDSSQKSS